MGSIRNSKLSYNPDIAIHPGLTLRETLEALNMTQAELAKRMSRPDKTINEIINGKTSITASTAHQLAQVLDIPAKFWINLENNYQFTKARIEYINHLKKQVSKVDNYPYLEMAKLGWVIKTRNKIERVSELLSFFGVTSLKTIKLIQQAKFRYSLKANVSGEAINAWLRAGEKEASKYINHESSFNKTKFIKALTDIKHLSAKRNSSTFSEMRDLCIRAGVIVIFVPHLKGTYVNGACRWLNSEKALIQLSVRNRYEDIFWFSFFHGAGHILLHGKREMFIDMDKSHINKKENEANDFAKDFLISNDDLNTFIAENETNISKTSILNYAKVLNISPAILVGRLQHEEIIPHSYLNDIRKKLNWAN